MLSAQSVSISRCGCLLSRTDRRGAGGEPSPSSAAGTGGVCACKAGTGDNGEISLGSLPVDIGGAISVDDPRHG